MRLAAVLLPLLLAACASLGTPDRAWLMGDWKMTMMASHPLPAESPTEPGVTVTGGSMRLDAAGRFELRLLAQLATRPGAADRSVVGRYRVRGDSLVMVPDGQDGGTMRFRFSASRGRLTLRDERGSAFGFVRADDD